MQSAKIITYVYIKVYGISNDILFTLLNLTDLECHYYWIYDQFTSSMHSMFFGYFFPNIKTVGSYYTMRCFTCVFDFSSHFLYQHVGIKYARKNAWKLLNVSPTRENVSIFFYFFYFIESNSVKITDLPLVVVSDNNTDLIKNYEKITLCVWWNASVLRLVLAFWNVWGLQLLPKRKANQSVIWALEFKWPAQSRHFRQTYLVWLLVQWCIVSGFRGSFIVYVRTIILWINEVFVSYFVVKLS